MKIYGALYWRKLFSCGRAAKKFPTKNIPHRDISRRIEHQPVTKKNYQSIQKNDDKLILWHDLINNTVAPHHSNSWKPCSVELLLSILHGLRHRIAAIVYTKRTNSTDILKRFRTLDILIIPVKKLLSTRKRKNNRILRDSGQIHPSLILEGRLIGIVYRSRNNLKKLILKKRSKSAAKK